MSVLTYQGVQWLNHRVRIKPVAKRIFKLFTMLCKGWDLCGRSRIHYDMKVSTYIYNNAISTSKDFTMITPKHEIIIFIRFDQIWISREKYLWNGPPKTNCFGSDNNRFPWESINDHDDDIKWKHFPRYWPFVPGIHRWIPITKASDTELWRFL